MIGCNFCKQQFQISFSPSNASDGTWPCTWVRAPANMYKNGADFMGGGEDWYPIFREHRGQWKRYCISCPLGLQNFEHSSCRVKESGTYLSSMIGSSATAFNLNTLALVSPESCERIMMALSVFRLGRAPRVLSITSCAFHQHVELSKVLKRTINSPQIQSIKGMSSKTMRNITILTIHTQRGSWARSRPC